MRPVYNKNIDKARLKDDYITYVNYAKKKNLPLQSLYQFLLNPHHNGNQKIRDTLKADGYLID
jgi:predicted transcriptional regulator